MAIGSAIGAVGSIAGGIIGSSGAKKAANAQAQAAAENAALQRELYGKNTQNISPFMDRGNQAGDRINALLGLAPEIDYGQYVKSNKDLLADFQKNHLGKPGNQFGDDIGAYGRHHYETFGQYENRNKPARAGSTPSEILKATPGYQFRFDEGMNALNTGFAAGGKLQSGAAAKAALRYGQDYASNEFGNYLSQLANQQGVGLSGANALAGVGTNFANSMSANNQALADARGNAALASSNAWGNAIGGVANSIGNALGSSYNSNPLAKAPTTWL